MMLFILNLVVSTIVFFFVANRLRRYLDTQGVPKGFLRGASTFLLASVISWGAGECVDWVCSKCGLASGLVPVDITYIIRHTWLSNQAAS